MMAPRRLRWGAVVGLLSVLLVLGAPAVAAAAEPTPSPALTVNPLVVNAGDRITVAGTGWPGSQLVDLSLCGSGGEGGSASCNRSGSATIGVGQDGRFGAILVAEIPPVACPCVIRGTAGGYTATQPITVNGAPVRTAPAAVAAPVATSVTADGSGPPSAWFGGSPERDVSVVVNNPSAAVAHDVRVEVRWGSPGSEQSRIVKLPSDVPAQGREVATTTISLGTLAWGDVAVRARVLAAGDQKWVSTTASSYPWGLLAIGVALVELGVLAILSHNRRKRGESAAERERGSVPPTEPDPAAMAEADSADVDGAASERPDLSAVGAARGVVVGGEGPTSGSSPPVGTSPGPGV